MTDRRTDRRRGKNNMSPDPEGGRHNNTNLQLMLKFENATYKCILSSTANAAQLLNLQII